MSWMRGQAEAASESPALLLRRSPALLPPCPALFALQLGQGLFELFHAAFQLVDAALKLVDTGSLGSQTTRARRGCHCRPFGGHSGRRADGRGRNGFSRRERAGHRQTRRGLAQRYLALLRQPAGPRSTSTATLSPGPSRSRTLVRSDI